MNILCPVCQNKLYRYEKTYACEKHHSFDIASQGYVNLNMRNSQTTGDNSIMIQSRKKFLEKGYYDFLRNKVNEYILEDDSFIDLACGEGYYTSFFKAKDKIGIDLSKQGLKIASKNDKSTTYLLNSIFHNPIEDNCADKIVTIFAPIAKQEIVRLLKKDGLFILVKPNVNHLIEMKQAVYDHPYLNEVEDIEIEGLRLQQHICIEETSTLNNEDLNNLFVMTPYVNNTSPKDKEKLKYIPSLKVTFSFIVDIYQKI